MALTNNFLPSTNLVFSPANFAAQMAERQKEDRAGVQNAFKFGTQLYDFLQSNKQADLMEQNTDDKNEIEASIAADTQALNNLKQKLAALQGA